MQCFRHDSVCTSAPIFYCCLNVILPGQISEILSQYLFKGPYKCSNKIPSGAATLPLFSSAREFIPRRPLSLACKEEVIEPHWAGHWLFRKSIQNLASFNTNLLGWCKLEGGDKEKEG